MNKFWVYDLPVIYLPILYILYMSLSMLLLQFPIYSIGQTYFIPHNTSKPIRVNAHRGGGIENIENTLGTFRHVWYHVGVDLVETDLVMTREGQVVVLHDVNLTRLFDMNQTID